MVENEEVTGKLNRQAESGYASPQTQTQGAANSRFTGNKLYAEYLRREGRPSTDASERTVGSRRERREVDDQFRDF